MHEREESGGGTKEDAATESKWARGKGEHYQDTQWTGKVEAGRNQRKGDDTKVSTQPK